MFEQSDHIGDLATALAKAQAQIGAARKSSVNPHLKNRYADLADVWDACREALSAHGLSVTQVPHADDGEAVYLYSTLMHSSGQWIRGRYPIRPLKNDPQSFGSALTYARRYSLSAMVGIVADDDDDGNGASGTRPRQDAQWSQQDKQEPRKGGIDSEKRLSAILERYADAKTVEAVDAIREFAMSTHREHPFTKPETDVLARAKASALTRLSEAAA